MSGSVRYSVDGRLTMGPTTALAWEFGLLLCNYRDVVWRVCWRDRKGGTLHSVELSGEAPACAEERTVEFARALQQTCAAHCVGGEWCVQATAHGRDEPDFHFKAELD